MHGLITHAFDKLRNRIKIVIYRFILLFTDY